MIKIEVNKTKFQCELHGNAFVIQTEACIMFDGLVQALAHETGMSFQEQALLIYQNIMVHHPEENHDERV